MMGRNRSLINERLHVLVMILMSLLQRGNQIKGGDNGETFFRDWGQPRCRTEGRGLTTGPVGVCQVEVT